MAAINLIWISSILLVTVLSQSASSVIFAQTFNLPQPSTQQKTVAQPSFSYSSYSNSIQVRAQQAFNQIRASALKFKLPSKTVRSQSTKIIYLILQQTTGERYRYAIKNSNLFFRLFDSDIKLLDVAQSVLTLIPQDVEIDSFTQLIKSKGQDSVYLAREGVRYPVNSDGMNDFGFSKTKVYQMQPCFMQLFPLLQQLS